MSYSVSDLEKLVDELHSKNEDLKSKLDGSVEAYVQMQKKYVQHNIVSFNNLVASLG
jgi:hypothetical protein